MGRSLGVNLVPLKTCDYNCVYCQLGRTVNYTIERREWIPKHEVLREIINVLENRKEDIDYVTLIGDGEPLLNSAIGWIIENLKKLYGKEVRIAVWSNGSLLINKDVREEILDADVVKVTVDCGRDSTYRLINRPYPSIRLGNVIESISEFRREYDGQLWVEVMLVDGINDGSNEIELLGKLLKGINPDKVHITVPTRPPAESWVKPPPSYRLIMALKILSNFISNVEILPLFEGSNFIIKDPNNLIQELISIIKVHPMRLRQLVFISSRLGKDPSEVLNKLLSQGVSVIKYQNEDFLVIRKKPS